MGLYVPCLRVGVETSRQSFAISYFLLPPLRRQHHQSSNEYEERHPPDRGNAGGGGAIYIYIWYMVIRKIPHTHPQTNSPPDYLGINGERETPSDAYRRHVFKATIFVPYAPFALEKFVSEIPPTGKSQGVGIRIRMDTKMHT